MKKILTVLAVLIVIAGSILGFVNGVNLTPNQAETLKILLIICACAAAYCFIVGQISGNTSQMDKLWSILPIAYVWVCAARAGMSLRLVVMAVLVTLWGIRLTSNFALKGAYSIKFWEGKEDYRWAILREKKPLSNKFVWCIFNLLFISIYQNALVLAITLPAVAVMESTIPFGVIDIIVAVIVLGFLILETVADRQQWNFYSKRGELLSEGKKLEDLPSPYNKGFNTIGIWGYCRHPNYLSEQSFWMVLYFFTLGAGVCHYGIFNWTIFGGLFLIFLFMGSSVMGEAISKSKYPEYANYQKSVCKYLPLWKYKG